MGGYGRVRKCVVMEWRKQSGARDYFMGYTVRYSHEANKEWDSYFSWGNTRARHLGRIPGFAPV